MLIVEVLVERVIAGPAEQLADRVLVAVARGEVLAILPAQLTDRDAHSLLEVRVRFRGIPGFVCHRVAPYCAGLVMVLSVC